MSRTLLVALCSTLLWGGVHAAEDTTQNILNNIAQHKRDYREKYMPPNPNGFLSSVLQRQRPGWGADHGPDSVSAQQGFDVSPVDSQDTGGGFSWLR